MHPIRRTSRSSLASAVRWAAMMPLVFVGAMMFWTMAFGLGGLSLVTLTGLTAAVDDGYSEVSPGDFEAVPSLPPSVTEPVNGHDDTITVQIQESTEPEDVLPSGYLLTTD